MSAVSKLSLFASAQLRQQRQASIKIQAAWRGKLQRQRLADCHRAACRIQAVFKGHVALSAFLQMRSTALLLQVMITQARVQK